MKKILFSLVVITSFMACDTKQVKPVKHDYPSNAQGYILDSTANIDIVKEINVDLTNYDFVKLRSHYLDSTKVHDNLNIQQIDVNLATFIPMKNAGIKFSIEGEPMLFEIIEKPDPKTGYTNYVDTYYILGVTKNGKKNLSKLNQIFAMKDGKVLEEWDVYDTAPFTDLMK